MTTYYATTIDASFLYQERHEWDANGNVTYSGYAEPGVGEAENAWLVVKYEYDASYQMTKKTYAGGVNTFTNAWQDRSGYSYA